MKNLKIYKIIMGVALVGSLSGCSSEEKEEVDNTTKLKTFGIGEHLIIEDINDNKSYQDLFRIKSKEGYKPVGIAMANHSGVDSYTIL